MTKLIYVMAIGLLFVQCSSSKKSSSSSSSSPSSSSKYPNTNTMAKLDESTFQLTEVSTDESYGYTESNPIRVGGPFSDAVKNEQRFLNALLGPDNQVVKYRRTGSCCPFKTPNGIMDGGLLDRYEITYEGLEKPIYLFVNMYDYEYLKAPKGFTFKK
ncbi:MAG: hypothetical protein K2P88_13905 [Chitinophagaceae bacterium]|nr:hypothetical protein [Chitinophagaceae bacterium]